MEFFHEIPWWLVTGILAAGFALLWMGNNRRASAMMGGGAAVMLVGLLLGVASYLLESPRERVIRSTHELVRAVSERNWDAMTNLLHPEITLNLLRDRNSVVRTTRWAAETSQLQSAHITALQVQETETSFTAAMQVLGNFRDGSGLSNWELDWEESGEQWLLREARFLGGPGMSPHLVNRYLRPRD